MAQQNAETVDDDMQLEYVVDKGGAKLKLQIVDGQYYPTFPTEVIKNMAELKIRKDDIILAGYLKAGTHWVWEILRMLISGSTEVSNEEKDEGMIEQTTQDQLDKMSSPRVLNTHVLYEKLPIEVHLHRPKIVYLTRNPKDTAVSMFHHHRKLWDYYSYDGTFENYLHIFVEGKVDYGSWFDHIKNWSQAITKYPQEKFMELNYEDLSQDPVKWIQKLADFLNLCVTDEIVNKIREECSFDNMKDKKGKFDLDKEGKPIMYRKGQVGDWKNHFSESQNTWFDEIYEAKMASISTPFHWSFEPN